MEKAGTFIEFEVRFSCLHLNVISMNVTESHDIGLEREMITFLSVPCYSYPFSFRI